MTNSANKQKAYETYKFHYGKVDMLMQTLRSYGSEMHEVVKEQSELYDALLKVEQASEQNSKRSKNKINPYGDDVVSDEFDAAPIIKEILELIDPEKSDLMNVKSLKAEIENLKENDSIKRYLALKGKISDTLMILSIPLVISTFFFNPIGPIELTPVIPLATGATSMIGGIYVFVQAKEIADKLTDKKFSNPNFVESLIELDDRVQAQANESLDLFVHKLKRFCEVKSEQSMQNSETVKEMSDLLLLLNLFEKEKLPKMKATIKATTSAINELVITMINYEELSGGSPVLNSDAKERYRVAEKFSRLIDDFENIRLNLGAVNDANTNYPRNSGPMRDQLQKAADNLSKEGVQIGERAISHAAGIANLVKEGSNNYRAGNLA